MGTLSDVPWDIFHAILDALSGLILPPLSSKHLRLPHSSPNSVQHISLYCVLKWILTILLCLGGYILSRAYLRQSYMSHYSCCVVSYRQTKVLIHYNILAGINYFKAAID